MACFFPTAGSFLVCDVAHCLSRWVTLPRDAAFAWSDVGMALIAVVGSLVWIKGFRLLATRGVIQQKLSRKLIHITSAPIFLLSWTLFSQEASARFVAAMVPALQIFRLVLAGTGVSRSSEMVGSISRSGDKKELLGGPLWYSIVLLVATLFAWRESTAGLFAVGMMCGGDGFADIVGRRFGKSNPLPFNKNKSWAGSVTMFAAGWATSMFLAWVFTSLGYLQGHTYAHMCIVAAVAAFAAAVAESLAGVVR